ncbi:MAG: hypothetical protein Q9216_006294 [Gyalolechia sp. 2 TL-2023]
MAQSAESPQEGLWLFGYGEDHRGTPSSPGRVVTLISHSHFLTLHPNLKPPPRPSPVWGAAYHIPPEHVSEVRSYLDIREINGYSIQYTPFQPADLTLPVLGECMVYIGLPENPQFLGVQDPDELARHIWKSKGPSGENKEYLFMLEEALNGLGNGAGDEHVRDVAGRVREVRQLVEGGANNGKVAEEVIKGEIGRVKSGSNSHEQEETEKLEPKSTS